MAGSLIFVLGGLLFLAIASDQNSPPLHDLVLDGSALPPGFSLDAAKSGATKDNSWKSEWSTPDGGQGAEALVHDAYSGKNAADDVTSVLQSLKANGFQPFNDAAIDGSAGASVSSDVGTGAVLVFARGSLVFDLQARVATGTASYDATALVENLAARQAQIAAERYGGTVSHSQDPAGLAGFVLGSLVGYALLVSLFGYLRDPLRPGQGSGPEKRTEPVAAGSNAAVDVSTTSRRLWREATVVLGVQLVGVSLVIDALLPGLSWVARAALLLAGIAVQLGSMWFRRRRIGREGGWSLRARPVRVTALFGLASVSAVLALGTLALYSLSQSAPGSPYYLGAVFCFLSAAAITRRRARRLASLSAHELMSRDPRPVVLYLRSFGDDNLRLRAATFGRRSLLERFTPAQFDNFEEVLARRLFFAGPVVAVNPPGINLPPLGAARETMSQDRWQGRVREWMGQARLIVIGGPPGTPSPGLVTELTTVADEGLWAKTILVTPPVVDRDLRWRWANFASAAPTVWPFGSAPALDPARILAVTRAAGNWTAITADRRTEWTYAAALRAAIDALSMPADGMHISNSGTGAQGSLPFPPMG